MSILIQEMSPKDYEDVLALNEASVPHVNSIGADELAWFNSHGVFSRIVRSDDRLAAFMIGMRPGTSYASLNYRWFCDHYDDFAYVDRIAVADWAQRRGIAEQLYSAFAESQRGVAVITCEVNLKPANEGSMRFHTRLGFRQVGSQETEGGTKQVALMERQL